MNLKHFLLTIVCTLFTIHTFAQQSDQIKVKYYYLKTWGFLKYYHPALASGRIDADSIFLKNYEAVDKIKNASQLDAILSGMISNLNFGQSFKPAPTKYSVTEMAQNVNQNWFTKETFLSVDLRKKLQYIYKNRFVDDNHHYYTPKHFSTEIPNEKAYAFPDSIALPYDYRMLSLAKIMAGVDYLFPHKYLMNSDWDKISRDAVPLFAKADTQLAYETQLLRLVAPLNDTHALRFYKEMKNWKTILKIKFYPPFDYQLVNNGSKVVVTKIIIPELCKQADIKEGDVITHVNDETISKRVDFIGEYLSASNPNALNSRLSRYLDNLLFPTDKLHAKLLLTRGRNIKKTTVEWVSKQDDFKKVSAYINNKLAGSKLGIQPEYAAPGIVIFRSNQTTRFLENLPEDKLKTAMDSIFIQAGKQKGIILDMRSYPDWGGFYYMMYNTFGNDKSLFARYYKLDKQHIGMYKQLTDNIEYYPQTARPGNLTMNAKIVILVDGETLSAGEYYTMFLQHMFPNAITIGSQSAGADGDDKEIILPGGYKFPFSGNAIFYPDGTQTQRKGVKIDKFVYPTISDVAKNTDTQLNEAIKWINQ
ncbi:S41 family peptidase [Chryseobacterium sp. PBS4-4]|uniref:S41 family peptidase n=1 Tax=Chryseobacterium edaphi TaxID=2976532 RepID=A0ABT2W8C6_9FLAO|nr:S41 family peptidase [Chryseobacterium edaphi]MCU7618444.1 S41 family peptidase [Chryseobacterium edaphi]